MSSLQTESVASVFSRPGSGGIGGGAVAISLGGGAFELGDWPLASRLVAPLPASSSRPTVFSSQAAAERSQAAAEQGSCASIGASELEAEIWADEAPAPAAKTAAKQAAAAQVVAAVVAEFAAAEAQQPAEAEAELSAAATSRDQAAAAATAAEELQEVHAMSPGWLQHLWPGLRQRGDRGSTCSGTACRLKGELSTFCLCLNVQLDRTALSIVLVTWAAQGLPYYCGRLNIATKQFCSHKSCASIILADGSHGAGDSAGNVGRAGAAANAALLARRSRVGHVGAGGLWAAAFTAQRRHPAW